MWSVGIEEKQHSIGASLLASCMERVHSKEPLLAIREVRPGPVRTPLMWVRYKKSVMSLLPPGSLVFMAMMESHANCV